jgi:hypothetical protein
MLQLPWLSFMPLSLTENPSMVTITPILTADGIPKPLSNSHHYIYQPTTSPATHFQMPITIGIASFSLPS